MPDEKMASMPIDSEIAAYEKMRPELEAKYTGKWVLFHDRKLVGIFETFPDAAGPAVSKYGKGPYLIRQVGAPPVVLPASVMYVPVKDAKKHKVRV